MAETQEKLQTMFDELSMYYKDWKLEVNTEKTKIMVFGSSNWQLFQFHYKDKTIGVTDCFRYLGFTFSNRGAVQGVNILSQSGLKTLRVIMNKVQQLGGLELDLQIKLFHTLVSDIWV